MMGVLPTNELLAEGVQHFPVDLVDAHVGPPDDLLLLEHIGCCFGLQIAYSCFLTVKSIVHILFLTYLAPTYYTSMPVW